VFTEKEPAPVVNTDLSDIPPEAIVGVRKVSIILEEEYLNQLKESSENFSVTRSMLCEQMMVFWT